MRLAAHRFKVHETVFGHFQVTEANCLEVLRTGEKWPDRKRTCFDKLCGVHCVQANYGCRQRVFR